MIRWSGEDSPHWRDRLTRIKPFGIIKSVEGENMKTKVIFRTYEKRDVIALFPEECGDDSPYTCSSYMHIGQHGAADPNHVLNTTRPASENEIFHLTSELEQIGYDLEIIKRNRYSFLKKRKDLLKEMNG